MTVTTSDRISEMTDVTERTIASTFGWVGREDDLYREVPAAFWLAPVGDEAIPQPGDLVLYASQRAEAPVGHPASVDGMATGIGMALLFAGPIFATLIALPLMDGIAIGGLLIALTILLPVTMLVGSVLGVVPVLAGAFALTRLGKDIALARTRGVWAATGAGMGLALSGIADAGVVSIPLVATAIACALIVHRSITWIDAED